MGGVQGSWTVETISYDQERPGIHQCSVNTIENGLRHESRIVVAHSCGERQRRRARVTIIDSLQDMKS